jgi:hypothetical protein
VVFWLKEAIIIGVIMCYVSTGTSCVLSNFEVVCAILMMRMKKKREGFLYFGNEGAWGD